MIVKRRKELMKFYFFIDIVAIIISFLLAYWFRFHSTFIAAPKGIPHLSSYYIAIPFFILVHLFYFSYQGYYKLRLRRNRLDDLFLVTINSFITSFTILLIFSYLKSYNFIKFEISHIFLLVYTPVAIINIFTLRSIIFNIFKNIKLKRNGISKILIAGEGVLSKLIREKLLKYTHFGIEVCGLINDEENDKEKLGKYKDFKEIATKYKITDLFIALPSEKYSILNTLVKEANNMYIDIKLIPDILNLISLKTEIDHIEGIPTINIGTIPLQGHWLFIKRSMDLIISILGLIALTPLFLTISFLIKMTSKGPIFYKQQRVGRDGRLFNIYKFRSMIEDAEKKTGAIWSPKNDLRITPIGRFLRKYSLDELPQLINVIKGEMSLVGPRPERPELVQKFMEDIPGYMLRHKVKSGMTGWAQVHGFRGNTPLEKRIDFDILYIQKWSLKLDLEILWRTILKLEFIDHNI